MASASADLILYVGEILPIVRQRIIISETTSARLKLNPWHGSVSIRCLHYI